MRQSDSTPPHGHFAMRVARRWHFISGGAHIFWVRLSWARRVFRSTRLEFLVRGLGALCIRSAQLSQLHHMLRYVLDVTVACGGPVTCWTTHQGAPMGVPMCLNFLGCQGVLEAKAREHFYCTARSHIIASDHTCGEVCNMVACGRYGRQ